MADIMGNEPHADPDAQATVTDFIDYTEHLPSDARRSLALIEKLNASTLQAQNEVHELTTKWNAGVEAVDGYTAYELATDLRARISYQKGLSSRYVAAALAEANRMNEEIARHQILLNVTASKLDALPLPPSRDPTPQPAQQSPQAVRHAGPAIKLRLGLHTGRVSGITRPGQSGGAPRSRRKRVIVPGEVLPPPNPDSPTPSDFSDSDSPEPPRVSPKPEIRRKVEKSERVKIPKPPKPPKSDVPKPPKKERPPRPPGVLGTNVHSQVAGISTSNALAKLTPPPPDAPQGGNHAPWMRLTEYEMAKLRKRMKKNAIWAPSDTMIRRELTDAGRGPEAYRKAKQHAEDTGTEFVDCDDLANKDPNTPLVPGEIPLENIKSKIINKGMSLNVQKKEKKALLQKQQAEQARLEAEQAASKLGQLGESFKNLFQKEDDAPPTEQIVVKSTPTARERKRKRESVIAPTPTEESQISSQLHSEIIVTPTTAAKPPKKQRKAPSATPAPLVTKPSNSPVQPTPGLGPTSSALTPTQSSMKLAPAVSPSTSTNTTTTTTTVPLAAPAPSPIKKAKSPIPAPLQPSQAAAPSQPPQLTPELKTASKPKTRRLSLVIKPPASPGRDASAPPTSTRPPSARLQSRPASRHASTGPPGPGELANLSSGAASIAGAGGTGTSTAPGAAAGAGGGPSRASRRKSATPKPSEPLLPNAAAVGSAGNPALHPSQAQTTLASRRTKRPAPGPVQDGELGGSAISVGKRSRRPGGKKGRGGRDAAAANPAANAAASKMGSEGALGPEEMEEYVDPNEPRYCVCGDVSYGTMVMCENPDCDGEWFHLECVGLTAIPPRRMKWWCPDCKRKMGMEA